MSETTRDKKQDWLEGLGFVKGCTPRDLIRDKINRDGLDWLTDEQIADLTQAAVAKLRRQNRMMIENRRIYAAQNKQEAA